MRNISIPSYWFTFPWPLSLLSYCASFYPEDTSVWSVLRTRLKRFVIQRKRDAVFMAAYPSSFSSQQLFYLWWPGSSSEHMWYLFCISTFEASKESYNDMPPNQIFRRRNKLPFKDWCTHRDFFLHTYLVSCTIPCYGPKGPRTL